MLAAGLTLQLAFGLVFSWGAVAPLVRVQEHWPAVLVGAVFSATPAGYGIGTAVGGRLADRLPPRRLCWAALGLFVAGLGITFAAPTGLTFVVFYAFLALGLGGGIALTGTVAAVARVLRSRAGTAGGAVSAAYAAAALFQAPVIGALAPRLGWLGALRLVGLGMAAAAAAALLVMPSTGGPAGGSRTAGDGATLRSPAVWTGCLLALCGAPFGAFAAVDLGEEAIARHLGAGLATAAIALFSAGNAFGRLLGGVAADRVGVGRVIAAVFLLELAAAALLLLGGGAATALAAALAAGLALGGDAGSLNRVGADAAPGRPNSAFGLVFTGFTVGAFAGPILGALAGTPTAWLTTALPAAAGLALLAARPRLLARTAA